MSGRPPSQKARQVRLLLLDVDGVLTDGRIVYDEKGREIKMFHVHDGQGIRWLSAAGIRVGLVSGRSSGGVEMRARELKIDLLYQGLKDKGALLADLERRTGIPPKNMAFMGDDFIDLPLLKKVGFSLSVPNGHPWVRRQVDYVTRCRGGNGAVREVCEIILKAQGKWKALLDRYGRTPVLCGNRNALTKR